MICSEIYLALHPVNAWPADCPTPVIDPLAECSGSHGAVIDIPARASIHRPVPLFIFGIGCCGRQVTDYSWLAESGLPFALARVLANPVVEMVAANDCSVTTAKRNLALRTGCTQMWTLKTQQSSSHFVNSIRNKSW